MASVLSYLSEETIGFNYPAFAREHNIEPTIADADFWAFWRRYYGTPRDARVAVAAAEPRFDVYNVTLKKIVAAAETQRGASKSKKD